MENTLFCEKYCLLKCTAERVMDNEEDGKLKGMIGKERVKKRKLRKETEEINEGEREMGDIQNHRQTETDRDRRTEP